MKVRFGSSRSAATPPVRGGGPVSVVLRKAVRRRSGGANRNTGVLPSTVWTGQEGQVEKSQTPAPNDAKIRRFWEGSPSPLTCFLTVA